MNTYGLIILVALLGSYLLEIYSEILNLKNLKAELPQEFKGYYDEEKYGKSQEYTRVTTRFGLLSGTFDIILLLVFWFSGGFNWFDVYLRSCGFGEVATGIFYIGILLLAKTIVTLPFSIYSTFVIEERFGFNKTTATTFLTDLFKGIVLSIIIGGLLMATVLWFFETAGGLAWFYCWIAVTFFILLLQFIAPAWIMPLFNKFSPLEEGELRNAIMNYAKSVDFSLQNLFVIDGSRRSSKSNAFFTGFGKNKRIALFDTLIEGHSVSELVAVLAHEIGHYKKKHVVKGMIISIIHMGVMLYLLSVFVSHKGLFDAFYMENISVYSGLIFFSLLFSPIEMILSIFMNIFSRKNEYEADRFAVETTGKGDDMINALKKLSVHNLSNLTPHPFYVFLNYSHPPLLERIRAIRG